jgi:hypothetical protein
LVIGHVAVSLANVALSLALGVALFAAALSISVAGGRFVGRGWVMGGVVAWLALAVVSMALSPRAISYPRGVAAIASSC